MKKIYLILFILLILSLPLIVNAANETAEEVVGSTVSTESDSATESDNITEGIRSNTSIWGYYEAVPGLHICERKDIAKIVRVVYLGVQIIRVVVPIILIINLMIKLTKAMSNPNQLSSIKKTIIINILAAVIIFLIPTFVSLISRLTGNIVNIEECLEKSENPKEPFIWIEDPVMEISKYGVYVVINSERVTGYYISKKKEDIKANDSRWIPSTKTKIDFVLLPGKYYIYARTNSNGVSEEEIEVSAKDIVVTNDAKDIKLLETDLDKFLLNNGSSLGELNEAIARSVYIAGLQTKEGAAAASLALTQILYIKYKIKIPYGHTHGNHIKMGAIDSWGSPDVYSREKQGNFYHQGMHCGGFVAWSYYQANFDMNPAIGSSAQYCSWRYAELKDLSPSQKASIGDVLTRAMRCDDSTHVVIVSAMDEGGYYVTESNARTGSEGGIAQLYDNIGIVTTYEPYNKTRFISNLDMTLTIRYQKRSGSVPSGF